MKLTRREIKPYREARQRKNDSFCELCGLAIHEGEAVLDHDHRTGLVRGVIHRSCNSVLGKVEKGTRYGRRFDPIAFASGLKQYLTKHHGDVIHPLHKEVKHRSHK